MSNAEKSYRNLPNRWVSVELGSTAQLTYSPLINPAPLTASSPGLDPVIGSLEVIITNQTSASLAISQIDFNIQVGTGASLTPTSAGIQYTLSDLTTWSIAGPTSPVTQGTATYSITPAQGLSAPLASGASLVVQIYGFTTNTTAGTTTIGIEETIGSGVGTSSFELATFPLGFYFDSLTVASLVGSSYLAIAQVPLNNVVTLLWNASVVDAGAVKILQSTVNGQQTFTPTLLGEWPTPTGLQTDTIFTVQITTTATPGGVPLVASLSTAIAVQNPGIVASTLEVSGASVLSGTVSTGGLTATAVTTPGIVTAGSLTTGALNATGISTLATVGVGTQLQVNGNFIAGASQINAALSVAGLASLTGGIAGKSGTVSVVGNPQAVNAGNYTAPTDGFAVGYVGFPSGNAGTSSICWIYGSTGGATVGALGGNAGYFDSNWNKGQASNPNSFLLPVAKGASWSVWAQQGTNIQTAAPFWFYWIPIGAGSVGQAERLGDAIITSHAHQVERIPIPKANLIGELTEIIESLTDKPIPTATSHRLREVLTKMNTDEYTNKEY